MITMSNEQNRLYDLYALTEADCTVEIIASRLAKINRYNGATLYPYSVAQHSVFVASLVPAELGLAALMHDAAEAWIVDLPRPVKLQCQDYITIEQRVEDQLAQWYPRSTPEIKRADHLAFTIERKHLRGNPQPGYQPWLREMTWREARDLFLYTYAGSNSQTLVQVPDCR